ncbi:MAG: YusW family protein [Lysinibacillus sp.]
MKKNLLFALPLSLLILAGCNNDKVTDVATDQGINNTPNEATTNKDIIKAETFIFSEFSLDVDYGVNDSFEVDYEVEESGIEASIEYRDNKEIKGNEAYKKLEPIFKAFKFTSASTDQEIFTEVLKAFDLDENYQDIEVEIHFTDGVNKEFKNRK